MSRLGKELLEDKHSQSFEETNPFPEQGKHRMHNPSIGVVMIVHLRIGV
jgi:hypothetical protein